jgi:hypothetical protein
MCLQSYTLLLARCYRVLNRDADAKQERPIHTRPQKSRPDELNSCNQTGSGAFPAVRLYTSVVGGRQAHKPPPEGSLAVKRVLTLVL